MSPRSLLTPRALTRTGFKFLHIEVNTGKMFAKIALKSKSEEKIARNRSRAREAYDTVLRFLKQLPLSPSESEDIHDGLKDLRADLLRLGEAV